MIPPEKSTEQYSYYPATGMELATYGVDGIARKECLIMLTLPPSTLRAGLMVKSAVAMDEIIENLKLARLAVWPEN
jgi:hypothetical protein